MEENMQGQTNEEMENQAEEVQIDKAKLQRYLYQLEAEQNLGLGILGGLAASIIGAILWAIITILTEFQIGWMAVGVGFLVGYAVRIFGKGLNKTFGIIGAAFSLFGCLVGNVLTICIFISREEGIPLLTILSRLDIKIIVEFFKITFSPMDLLFYGIALYEGYRLSFRQISEAELASIVKNPS